MIPQLRELKLLKKKQNQLHQFFLMKIQFLKQKTSIFLLITVALLITVSIYCYLIKYKAKPKLLSLFHATNNELKDVLY